MGIEQFLSLLGELYEAHEWNHACAILAKDFPEEWKDIVEILRSFHLRQAYINKGGGNKSPVAHALDSEFYARNWIEKSFDTKVTIDKETIDSPTHKVDCFRNRVALEVEWNNKDPFFDRDLNNFRLLFELSGQHGAIGQRCIFNDRFKECRIGKQLAEPAVVVFQMLRNLVHLRGLID